ncbi:MAG: GNAT family N-acetyltransferase [Steroidobacteraceae bacterium]
MIIRPLDPEDPAAERFIGQLDAYQIALYPPESNHLESIAALKRPNVAMFGGYLGDELVACGAVKFMDDDGRYVEVKRVFVPQGYRGRGLAQAIMAHLEAHALRQGVTVARLETGVRQPEALRLYEKLGYTYREPFGRYRVDPLSVFMEKRLA